MRVRRLQEQGVGKDGEWGGVLRRPLFARASDGGSASLAHLAALFVERQHTLWKARAVLQHLPCTVSTPSGRGGCCSHCLSMQYNLHGVTVHERYIPVSYVLQVLYTTLGLTGYQRSWCTNVCTAWAQAQPRCVSLQAPGHRSADHVGARRARSLMGASAAVLCASAAPGHRLAERVGARRARRRRPGCAARATRRRAGRWRARLGRTQPRARRRSRPAPPTRTATCARTTSQTRWPRCRRRSCRCDRAAPPRLASAPQVPLECAVFWSWAGHAPERVMLWTPAKAVL